MATYKKPTITLGGSTFMRLSFAGDANAYESFENHKTIKAGDYILVPFHAVKFAWKEVTTADTEKTDAYCE